VFVLAVSVPLFAQQSLLDQGRAALQRNDAETAKNLLEQAIAQTPNNVEAHYLLGQAYGSLISSASMFSKPGLAKKTREQFEKAIQLDPNFIDARFGMIEWFLEAPSIVGGGEDKAIAEANEVKKRDAIDGHRAFALIYGHQKKTDLVRKEYVDAVKEQPNSPRAHYYLGVSNLTSKDNAGASAEFETAIKIDPQYMPGWFQVGHMAALTGTNMERGEEALRRYLSYTPKRNEPPVYRAHYWLGTIYEKQGKKAEAKASFAKALSANPNQKDVQEAMKRVS
jgi:Tfp pilus assembly protein PilF